MQIIEYFTSDRKEHWLSEIEKSDWSAGRKLAELLQTNLLKAETGETTLLFLLTDGDALVSFCTFAPLDDVQPTPYSPWIGFVYTFPAYRGHRYVGQLLDYAESIAAIMGKESVYINTDHVGLYEKYGYTFLEAAKDSRGQDTRIYRKTLTDDPDKDARMERGGRYKGEIVAKAREGIDPVAYCGFSCNHCFLGQWCGGCRSVFNCCSYATLFEKGRCPNAVCCLEKGLDGCYNCPELENCKTGFYRDENSDGIACKAQALFIRKHGKEAFLRMLAKLGETYEPQALQEKLKESLEKGLEILESAM